MHARPPNAPRTTPFLARATAWLAVLSGPGTMAAWWVWALFDSELAVFAGLVPLIVAQLIAAVSTIIARGSSRSWFRPRAVPWLVIYHGIVAASAVYLIAEVSGPG